MESTDVERNGDLISELNGMANLHFFCSFLFSTFVSEMQTCICESRHKMAENSEGKEANHGLAIGKHE